MLRTLTPFMNKLFKRSLHNQAKFWSKVDVKNDKNRCWSWKGSFDDNNYGFFYCMETKTVVKSHRFALEIKLGRKLKPYPIECSLHKCDHPWCVNPNHLFVGTHAINTKDMIEKMRKAPMGLGSDHPGAKLNEITVEQIKEDYAKGIDIPALALKHKVSRTLIRLIVIGKIWKHIL